MLFSSQAGPGSLRLKRTQDGHPGGVPVALAGVSPSRCRLSTALAPHLILAAAAGGTATPAQRNSVLGQDPVDEAVGPSCRGCQGTDALAGVVPPAEGDRQLAAIGPGYP